MMKQSLKKVLFVIVSVFSVVSYASETVIATRGGEILKVEEFSAWLNTVVPESQRSEFVSDAARIEQAISNLLENKQIISAAKAADFDQSKHIQLRLQQVMEKELAQLWLKEYVSKQQPANYEAMAREEYIANKDRFMDGEKVSVTHLLVSTAERSEEEARTLAEGYLTEAKSNPESFKDLVMAHSEDPSKGVNGGTFPDVKRGRMVKPFEEAAFLMRAPGEFSDLVQTQFGYHIIRLDQYIPAGPLPFDYVKSRLIEEAKQSYEQTLIQAYVQGFYADTFVVEDQGVKEFFETNFPETVGAFSDGQGQ